MGIGKIIIGLILVIVGLWSIMPIGWGGGGAWDNLLFVLIGIIPAFLVFIGAIIIWIEWEELKIEKPTKKKR
jgi:hypothetical protein